MRASRERWPVGRRVEAVRAERRAAAIAAGCTLIPVTSPAAIAIDDALQVDGHETRAALSRATRRAAEHAAGQEGAAVLKNARGVKAVAETAALVHGWDRGVNGDLSISVNVLSIGSIDD
jgi:hypothetical protein